MKALVTGSKGFIGKHLCGRLREVGIDVVAGDSNKRDYVDVSDMNRLKTLERVEVIIHLAAKTSVTTSIKDPYQTYRTNCTRNIKLA